MFEELLQTWSIASVGVVSDHEGVVHPGELQGPAQGGVGRAWRLQADLFLICSLYSGQSWRTSRYLSLLKMRPCLESAYLIMNLGGVIVREVIHVNIERKKTFSDIIKLFPMSSCDCSFDYFYSHVVIAVVLDQEENLRLFQRLHDLLILARGVSELLTRQENRDLTKRRS